MSPYPAPKGRRKLRQRAFAGYSLRNADALDGVKVSPEVKASMTVEKPIPTVAVAGLGKKLIKMSSADSDPAFTRIRNGWRDDLRSESLKQTEDRIALSEDPERFEFQGHAFDTGLQGEDVPAAIYQQFRGGGSIVQLKRNNDFNGWRRKTPWWLMDSAKLDKLQFSKNNLDILRSFYLAQMTDDDIYEEMKLVFSELEGEGEKRHTSSGKAVKQRRLALVKKGNTVFGEQDPHAEKPWSIEEHRENFKMIREAEGEREVPLPSTVALVTVSPAVQAPGWIQAKEALPGHYALECAVPECHEFRVLPEPRHPDALFVCLNHSTRIQKATLRAIANKTKVLHE